MPPWQRASRISSADNSDLYAPPTPRRRSPRVRFSNRIRPAGGMPPQTQRATLASRDTTERSTASRSFSRPGRVESPHMTPAVFGQQEKPLRHIILGVDIGFKMTKIAVASYLDGDDSASISPDEIADIYFPGAPSKLLGRQVPTQSLYPTTDLEAYERTTAGQTTVLHGFEAQHAGQMYNRRPGLATNFKPRECYPETTADLPDESSKPTDTQATCVWPDDFAATLVSLKEANLIESDEDVITNFMEWAFRAVKKSESGPYEAGRDIVSAYSKVTIVVGCPVRYSRRARAILKRLVSKAAVRADIGMVVPVSVGEVVDDEQGKQGVLYDVEDDITHDLTNVYLATESNAALLFFLARMFSTESCADLVRIPLCTYQI
jgi:hypothetical protein